MSEPEIFSLEAASLPMETRVAAYEGRERLSETFSYKLWLLVPESAAESIDPAAVALSDGRFAIQRSDATLRRQVHGVFASLELIDEHPGGDALYVAELVPTAWKLKLSRHSRVWVDKTLREIVRDVFTKAGLDGSHYEDRLTGTYAPIPHVCQYRESDYDFVARWFEREGIYFTFEHSDAGDKLVYLDDLARHVEADDGLVHYRPETREGDSGHEGFRRFTQQSRYLTREVKLRDHDPLKPTTSLDVTETVDGRRAPQVVRHMEDHYLDLGPGRRLARLRAGEQSTPATGFEGEGRVFGVAPGQFFELTDHPRASFNRNYFCTGLVARGRLLSDEETLRRWVPWFDVRAHWSEVSAMPADVQFRPALVTPRPRVSGIEVAHVDGPVGSDYAQLDAHGRYLVRFRFDENEGPDGTHSTRVRMLQAHAGSPEGMHFPLRKGTEVTVAFVAGDPDRPVITGAVPDADRPSTVTASNHTQNVIQTGGENRVEMEDSQGAQYIDISSPPQRTFLHLGVHHGAHTHNYVTSTDGNGLLHTGGNLDVTVGGNKHEHVTKTLRETYCDTLSSEVDGTVTETHLANMTTTVTAHVQENSNSHTTHVKGHTIERCQSQRTEVSGHLEEKHGTHNVLVDGRLYVKSGTHDATTKGLSDCHYGTLLIQVKGAFTLTSAGPISITALNWADNAPIAYRIVTTKRQKVNRADITIHPFFFEAIGLKHSMAICTITFNAWKADVLMFARALNGAKVDFTASKFDVIGAKVKLGGPKLKTFALRNRVFAVSLFA